MRFKPGQDDIHVWYVDGVLYEIGTCELDEEENVVLINGTGLCYEHLQEFPG